MRSYLMSVRVIPGHAEDLRPFLETLAPDALGVPRFTAFLDDEELLLLFEAEGAHAWNGLFEGERGSDLRTHLRQFTNLDTEHPEGHVLADTREAPLLPPSEQPSPDRSFVGG